MRNEQIEAAVSAARFTKITRRARFLAEMDEVVPRQRICKIVQSHSPAGAVARLPPVGVERMLHIYVLQQWYDLSDPAVEEALHDIPSLRALVEIDLNRERVPDEITVWRFRSGFFVPTYVTRPRLGRL
jgi:IS5 family transposase